MHMQIPATISDVAPTKNRVMRIPQDVWEAAQKRAGREGRTLTETVTWFLRRYADGRINPWGREDPAREAPAAPDNPDA